MREIKFDFIYRGDFQFHHKKYYLDELLLKPLKKLSDVHCQMPLIAKRQYTGLKDKNGVEIFEGDVVRHHIHVDFSTIKNVEYFNGGFVLIYDTSKPYKNTSIGSVNTSYTVEVIGNIYETPKLLD